ncbi:DUF3078 domain-containing protein [Pedobacter sp.]|jgi:hypothetical protein|uniref:DUF3078 domain-containing protein n=1 Tax=Pedobacter sp. TaxID=1411316 RepID=UPI002B519F21|nr:DUF3078 domain-containing protein [Pedobacter sp.]HWW41273.1 DUF3078 domain-containing protein [Pedobacter sp.]
MKNFTFTLLLMVIGITGYAQDTAPKADTTKKWTIHGENTFLINQSSFSNWSAGGVNSVAGNLVFNYDFNYKKDKWSWDNKAILGYGLSKQQGIGTRKNDDRIILNSLLGYKAAQYWLYTFYANFQTQFSKGWQYNTSGPNKLISDFLAPGYLTFGPGFAYKKSDNFRVNISPFASRIIIVRNNELSQAGAFGVDPGKKVRYEFGASLDAYYKVNVMENIGFENILKLYSNYLDKPGNIYTDYTANLFMKVNKFVTVNAGVQLIYDDKTKIQEFNTDGTLAGTKKALQVKQIFGAGLTYKF